MSIGSSFKTLVTLVATGNFKTIAYKVQNRCRRLDLRVVELRESGLSEEHAKPYVNSGGPLLERALREIRISPSDAVLDFGCGKCGAMLTLAQFPFGKVDGIELSPELARVGETNLKRAKFQKGSLFEADAAEFTELDQYTFFYLYNPFPEEVLQRVLINIMASQTRRPRTVTLIYMTPVGDTLVKNAGFQEVCTVPDPERPISIYNRKVPSAA